MFKGLIKKMISEVLADKSGQADQLAEIASLKAANSKLQEKLESSSASKGLKKLKEIAAAIPAGAQGMGAIAILENGVMKTVELKSVADLQAVITRAENNEIEVVLS